MPEQSQIRKVLYNEVSFAVAIVAVAFGVINWIYSPAKQMDKDIALIQQSIHTIESNHLTHLQNYAEEIKDLTAKDEQQQKDIIQMSKDVDRLLFLMEEHVKKTR